METRSQTQGKPLKKEGAYNPDLYYQEMDQGYGDVGVDQEPDAAALTDRTDPDFKPTAQDMQASDRVLVEEERDMGVDEQNVREEAEDLRPTADTGAALDERGDPVPVEQETPDELEANDAGYTLAK